MVGKKGGLEKNLLVYTTLCIKKRREEWELQCSGPLTSCAPGSCDRSSQAPDMLTLAGGETQHILNPWVPHMVLHGQMVTLLHHTAVGSWLSREERRTWIDGKRKKPVGRGTGLPTQLPRKERVNGKLVQLVNASPGPPWCLPCRRDKHLDSLISTCQFSHVFLAIWPWS